jgi:hypothetical protein
MNIIESETDHVIIAHGTFKPIPMIIFTASFLYGKRGERKSWHKVIYPAIKRFLVREYGPVYNRRERRDNWTCYTVEGIEIDVAQRVLENKNPAFIFAKWDGTAEFIKIEY